ncbi:2'-5' RNA ligase [Syntrophobotulus glycolicus DSM 8271]|uniref:RNA 2',3'-cyclic phosphodiesterase n=1 Tax=Syntrophobotulus glycolicus (strain DSM 8271 / FlGlyR) TaxID=645991 RepID=F0STQ4_SYNGF|nr:RNA 2',3'-cyclic phosphodiesterase [Syntrophobotulus glycolicus]ADY55344.1 2'-5' RNA ligase [Syntrophobotulus glycolicus DSM 8271]
MRLFLAINFDAQTKEHILAVQGRLREAGRGSFSHPENLHLTLAFLGEVEPRREAAAREALDSTAVPPMKLIFDHAGRFRREGGDIWWLGLGTNKALITLQKELSAHLQGKGFILENRRFSPHITLARQVLLHKALDESQLLGIPFGTEADTVSLMLSERVNGKLTYTQRHAVRGKR